MSIQHVAACDAQMRGDKAAMVQAGLPQPKTLGDVVRVMWAAQGNLNANETAQLARHDKIALELARKATQCSPLGSPHIRYYVAPATKRVLQLHQMVTTYWMPPIVPRWEGAGVLRL